MKRSFFNRNPKHRGIQNGNLLASSFNYLICAVLLCTFIPLLVSLCFFNNATVVIDQSRQLLMAFVFLCVLAFLYVNLSASRKFFLARRVSFGAALLMAFVCLFALQLYIVHQTYTVIGWDVYRIIEIAEQDPPVISDYLSRFPNNLLLFFVVRHIMVFFMNMGLYDLWLQLAIVNTLLVDLALIIACVIAKRLFGGKTAILFFILASLLIGLSPWLIVPYSDTFSMPVIAGLALCCLRAIDAKAKAKRVAYVVACGILFAVGWLLKPTVIAVMAAVMVALLLYILTKRSTALIKRLAAGAVVAVMSAGLVIYAFNIYTENQDILIYDKSIQEPITYTITTGLVETPQDNSRTRYGSWNEEVVTAVAHSDPTDVKAAVYSKIIRDKLQEYGLLGYAKFLINKARWITAEGDFFWGREGSFADFDILPRNFFTELFYTDGIYYSLWLYAVGGLWIVVFFGCCLGMISRSLKGIAKRFDAALFLQLTLLFIILTVLFTEGRSRYLISFLPLFCIVSASGYYDLTQEIKRRMGHRKML